MRHYLLRHYLLWHYSIWWCLREVDEGGSEAVGIPLDHDVLPRLGEVAVQHAPAK